MCFHSNIVLWATESWILIWEGKIWNLKFLFKKKSGEFKFVSEKFEYVFDKLSGEFAFESNVGSEVFKKLFRFNSPCYLSTISGECLFGIKDKRRCFLRCLQVSSNSSLLFNIELCSAVRIMSFSMSHKSHAPTWKCMPLCFL